MSVRGFSFLEILVVLVIIGMLAMLAYPSYAAYVTRTRRSEGQIALLAMLQQQERYFTLHNRYLAFSAGSPQTPGFRWWSGSTPVTSAYELRAQACPGTTLEECVEVQAEPGTGLVDGRFRDPDCGVLSATSNGQRQPAPGPKRCWP